jgi:hypothetical protein
MNESITKEMNIITQDMTKRLEELKQDVNSKISSICRYMKRSYNKYKFYRNGKEAA